MACTTCNSSTVLDCTTCNTTHLACHPCYNTAITTCTAVAHTATPIDTCIVPTYCSTGCDETIESDCVTTPCGTLTETLALLIDPVTCVPLTTATPTCVPLGAAGVYTACLEDAFDIKTAFLASNPAIDATGSISLVSGPAAVTEYPITFTEAGTYVFEYAVYTGCHEAQLITVNVAPCVADVLTLSTVDCANGTTTISGTYATTGTVPTLIITTGQTATNISIAGGVVSFDFTSVNSSQILSFYLKNEVSSNQIDVALQFCEECALNIVETQGGCVTQVYLVSELLEITDKADVTLTADSIVFSVDYKCVLDTCGSTLATSNSYVSAKLETHIVLDYSDFVDGVSYINSIGLTSDSGGDFTVDLNPTTTGNAALLYDSSNISTWQNAVQAQIQAGIITAGFTGSDYLFFQYNSGTEYHLNFRVKHTPAGEWIGFNVGTSTLDYFTQGTGITQVLADFGATDFTVSCNDTDACGNVVSITYTVALDNIDYTLSNFNTIVLLSPRTSVVEVVGSQSTSFCALEITLSAVFSGCLSATYLWSNGATTATISNVPVGVYTVTVTCSDCTETASYEIVAAINCNTIPFITYDCRAITCNVSALSNAFNFEFDTITITGIGEVITGQIIYLPDGQYEVTFALLGCPDKVQTLIVGCVPYWRETAVIYGSQVCETTFNLAPANQNNNFTAAFLTLVSPLGLTYTTADIGKIYSYGELHSIVLTNITASGIVTFKSYSTSTVAFVQDVVDYSVSGGQSLVNTFELCL